jgi:hypothetical protein
MTIIIIMKGILGITYQMDLEPYIGIKPVKSTKDSGKMDFLMVSGYISSLIS